MMNEPALILTLPELEAGLDHIRQSPKGDGMLAMIVRRPVTDEREVLEAAELDLRYGLVGDCWFQHASRHARDGILDCDAQLTIMNARSLALVANERERWPLAGDQLIVDFDLSDENAPAGSRLSIGCAVVEISASPHTGCHKFAARFGPDAVRFVNSTVGKQLHLRGVNAKVIRPGAIRIGDRVRILR